MNSKNLINSLKVQDENLNGLLNSLEQQKNAIINNDFTSLELALSEEQKFLRNIEKEELNRQKIINDLLKENNINVKSVSLKELIKTNPNIFAKDLKEIEKLRLSLLNKSEKIKQINLQLKDVIEFSRALIKETMMIVAQKNNKMIVNKRV